MMMSSSRNWKSSQMVESKWWLCRSLVLVGQAMAVVMGVSSFLTPTIGVGHRRGVFVALMARHLAVAHGPHVDLGAGDVSASAREDYFRVHQHHHLVALRNEFARLKHAELHGLHHLAQPLLQSRFAAKGPGDGEVGGTGDHPFDIVRDGIQARRHIPAPIRRVDALDHLHVLLLGHSSSFLHHLEMSMVCPSHLRMRRWHLVLERYLVHHVEIDELRRAFKRVCHSGLQFSQSLPAWIPLARPRLLLTLDHDHHVERVRVFLVPHHTATQQAGIRLLDGPYLLQDAPRILLLARLNAHLDDLCPHGTIPLSPFEWTPT